MSILHMHRLAICLQRIENSLRAVTGLSIVLVENSSTGRPRIRNLEIEDARNASSLQELLPLPLLASHRHAASRPTHSDKK